MASTGQTSAELPDMATAMKTEQEPNEASSRMPDPSSVKHDAVAEKGPDPKPPMPVDGGYGWVCVISVFLINCHTFGINSVSPGGIECTNRRVTEPPELRCFSRLLYRE